MMQTEPVIMVQVADPEWTCRALDGACALARDCGGRIALVHTVQVKHLAYLGSAMGYMDFYEEDERRLQSYCDLIAASGIDCSVTLYQACNPLWAVVDIVELVDATYVYAKPQASLVPLWSACEFELLRVRLARQNCELVSAPAARTEPLRLAPTMQLKTKG
jgi:hypothetical protein